jgi:hypothetical protein
MAGLQSTKQAGAYEIVHTLPDSTGGQAYEMGTFISFAGGIIVIIGPHGIGHPGLGGAIVLVFHTNIFFLKAAVGDEVLRAGKEAG